MERVMVSLPDNSGHMEQRTWMPVGGSTPMRLVVVGYGTTQNMATLSATDERSCLVRCGLSRSVLF